MNSLARPLQRHCQRSFIRPGGIRTIKTSPFRQLSRHNLEDHMLMPELTVSMDHPALRISAFAVLFTVAFLHIIPYAHANYYFCGHWWTPYAWPRCKESW
eukprot:Filipodium_phascolosomae@DN1411_c0_g1_i2.p1